MAKTKTFNGVTPAIWECVKTTSLQEHGTIYAPAGATKGTATTSTIVGDVVLNFDFESSAGTVTYTIVKKPFIVGESTIWDGIQDTIDSCNQS
ncbi:hypothetical protein BH09BAC6_BH09BAC6_07610 [soil metagenome]